MLNLFLRVRPLSNKEVKAGDDMAVQFPGDGQIYVSMWQLNHLNYMLFLQQNQHHSDVLSHIVWFFSFSFLHFFSIIDNKRKNILIELSETFTINVFSIFFHSAMRFRAAATKSRKYFLITSFSNRMPRRRTSYSTPALRILSKWQWKASAALLSATGRPEVAKRILWLGLRDS